MKKVFFSKYWVVLLLLVIADGLSKAVVFHTVPLLQGYGYPFGGIPIWDGVVSFSLNLVFNTGAAWGLFPDHAMLLFWLRVAMIGMLLYFLCSKRAEQMGSQWPFWFISAGAIGNVIDMIYYSKVVDFLHFCFWGWSFPVFNLADSYITLGVCWVSFFGMKKKEIVSGEKE